MTREQMLQQLTAILVSLPSLHPLRVAIDGIDTAGKSTLVDELTPHIEQRGRPVIRASLDGFHRPRHERYQKGSDSPEGYYEDSFDYSSLRTVLLEPLGLNGSRWYQRAAFDFRTDTPLNLEKQQASQRAILLFDGVFLLRPELANLWDYRIFISVTMEVALQRAIQRDQSLFGSPEAVQVRYIQRYFPGQRLYYQHARPLQHADVIVDNNDVAHPKLVFPSQTSDLHSFEL